MAQTRFREKIEKATQDHDNKQKQSERERLGRPIMMTKPCPSLSFKLSRVTLKCRKVGCPCMCGNGHGKQ